MAHSAIAVFLILIVLLYLALCPRLNYALYRRLLFHPMPFIDDVDASAPVLADISGLNVTFRNGQGDSLHGWYYQLPDAQYTVLFSHGNGGNMGYRCDTVSILLENGFSAFIYDYRGYGRSEGVPSVEGICDDALSAYDCLNRVLSQPESKIILYGESLGCAVSTDLSRHRQCAGLILQSGFLSLSRIACEVFPALILYPGKLLADPPLDSLSIMQRQHSPLLIIHGKADKVVSFAHATKLFAAACEPKRFLELPSSGHTDICTSARAEFSSALREFALFISSASSASSPELSYPVQSPGPASFGEM